ncbi:MAG: capsule synthesis protein cap [Bacteroidota bacterium]|nr:capsule synthesis protein cap [Bacteroidota bacterium]
MGKDAVIHFLGDVSFNDAYVGLYKKGIKPFNEVGPVLAKADYVIGNLESQVIGAQGENLLKNPRVKTEKETLNYLHDLDIDLVSVATNHTYDGLRDGVVQSFAFLDEHKILHVGASLEQVDAYKPITLEVNEIKFGFLNYVHQDTHPSTPKDADVYLNYYTRDKILNQIDALRKEVDFVVLLFHWGGLTDYGFYPHHTQISEAHMFLDRGADVIIGHHTHTFQAIETYKGKPIFYSLGNFCFADIYSGKKLNKVRVSGKEGAIVELKFNAADKTTSYKLIPIANEDHMLKLAPGLSKKYAWRNFKFFFVKNIIVFRWCYYFYRANIEPLQFYFEASEKNWFQRIRDLNFKKVVGFIRFILNMKKKEGF